MKDIYIYNIIHELMIGITMGIPDSTFNNFYLALSEATLEN